MSLDLQTRKERYFALSSRLAHVDNRQLETLLGDTQAAGGWGRTYTIKLVGQKVFVKRVPLTDLEYENLFSTANLYGMPTFYNYGVGSAGFGAFRELVAHLKTTNWVLEGAIANFPLMYHHRIVPFDGTRKEIDLERHQGYVKYWNGDENIDRYIRDRHTAKHELILFLEHFPFVLESWLVKNRDKSGVIVREMLATTRFLREHGVIHFDAHFHNIVTDGERPYLVDFGLVLDKAFALSASEREFFSRHIDYDDAEFLQCLGTYINVLHHKLPSGAKKSMVPRFGIRDGMGWVGFCTHLIDRIEEIHESGLMNLDGAYVEEIVRYRDLIKLMLGFLSKMRENDKKDTPHPARRIRRILQPSRASRHHCENI